jgi:hypothetical protein
MSSVSGCAHSMYQPDPALGPDDYEAVYYDEVPEGAYGSEGMTIPEGYELVDPSNPPIGGEYVMGDVEWSDEYADCEYEESDAEREARHALAKKRCDYAMYRAEDRVTSGTVKCLRKGRDAVDTTIDDVGNCAQKHIHRIPIYLHRIPGKLRKVPVRSKKVALSCHPTPFYRGPVVYSGSYVRHL